MKIKVKDCSYERLLQTPQTRHKNPCRQNPLLRKLMYLLSKPELKAVNFTCQYQCDLKAYKSCLFLMNHSSFTDLQIAASLLKDRPYHIVCTNDGLVGKEGLMRGLGCIPAKKFITDLALVKDMKYVADKLDSSILMFPEASYSFDGKETPLPDSLGKCIKLLNLPVIMIRTSGAFLRDPLYNNLQKRDVQVSAKVSCLFTPDQIKEKSSKEINEVLKSAFHYDHFREQEAAGILVTEPFRADGLHRVLYKCPACQAEGKMLGKGIEISCKQCGRTYHLTENGRLKGKEKNQPTEYSYVSDWYRWERECVRQEIQEEIYQMDLDVDILMLSNADLSSVFRIGEGKLIHNKEGFHLTGCQGKLDFSLSPKSSYSLYADYYWYELGDMISIGDSRFQYYCFPKNQEEAIVAKARLAAEELAKG